MANGVRREVGTSDRAPAGLIPVIGYADDAIIVAAVLRSVVRRAGPDAEGFSLLPKRSISRTRQYQQEPH
jgi:uncharacterized membrane protein YkvA (DUF1232 family)